VSDLLTEHSLPPQRILLAGGPLARDADPLNGATALGRVDRAAVNRRAPGPADRAQLLFTSGTSGVPKIVAHSHASLTAPIGAGKRLDGAVVWTVGALCDYVSGRTPRAPRWLADNGFEWIFRLAIEPQRMWRRYLLGNPVFIQRVLREAKTLSGLGYRPLIVAYRNGMPVRLDQIGRAIDSVQNDKTAGWVKGTRAIVLAIERQPGTNTVEVVDNIKRLLPTIRAELPATSSRSCRWCLLPQKPHSA